MTGAIASILVVAAIVLTLLALLVLREARTILKLTQQLSESLQRETLELVKEATALLVGTKAEVLRVEDLIEVSENRSEALNAASKVALGALSAPIVRVHALRLGIRRGMRLFRANRGR